jgi:hypothetical protein
MALYNIESAHYDRLIDEIDRVANGLLLRSDVHNNFDGMYIAFELDPAAPVSPRNAVERTRLTVAQGEDKYRFIRLQTDVSRPYGDQLAIQHEGTVSFKPVEGSLHPPPSAIALGIHAALAKILRASARGTWDEHRPSIPPTAAPAVLAKEGGERGAAQLAEAFGRHGYRW